VAEITEQGAEHARGTLEHFDCLFELEGHVWPPRTLSRQRHQGLRPSGRNSSLALLAATSGGAPVNQGAGGVLPGGYSDSIGAHGAATRSVNRSPIRRSVMMPLSCGKVRTNWPKLKPS